MKEAKKSSVERDWRKGNNLYPLSKVIGSEDFVTQDLRVGGEPQEIIE